jgi:biotin carboxyl carrier protein
VIRRYSVTVAGEKRAVELEELPEAGGWRVVVDGQERRLDVRAGQGTLSWLDGTTMVVAAVDGSLPKPTVTLRRQVIPLEITDAREALAGMVKDRGKGSGPATVRAPIPGRVVRLLVKAGDQVAAGKGLVVLEAMKMENELRAPRDGVIKSVGCAEGAAVEAGQTLVVIE